MVEFMRLLVVDDQHTLARNIQKYLQMEALYTVDVAFDGKEGMHKALSFAYDCIILDVMLPQVDGFTVCTHLRQQGCHAPILLLTALKEKTNTIKGLDAGADDYLTKPFNMAELYARIRALLRRDSHERNPLLSLHGITLDPNTKDVRKKKKKITLAPREYALLEYLFRHAGVVQSREDIIEHVWGESEAAMFSQTLDVHIAYLRKKIGKDVITTIPGSGYMISP